MGMVLGKISVETPKYELVRKEDGFEVRDYAPRIIAEVSYDPAEMRSGRDGGFSILADYIGALGKPKNEPAQKIAMTAPVITKQSSSGGAIANAPVIESKSDGRVTMQFVLPSGLTMESIPRPMDERVRVIPLPQQKFGVLGFTGVAGDDLVKNKVELLRKNLAAAGYQVAGDYILARYNPPWTPGFLRTNEVMLPLE
ncbi:hypothetical protein SELMODRAFT_445583 [Selaginella moellendorffii]|uniref:SOUL heme-binding protein n=1 Tax=Selaginella moellendorffii TaxID=88036 RepID=D8SJQ8_SELML|nr:heme-binding-like protein At3g10130, chloroplastic [Selaginella moellendorffii]EFJ15491.1 hypothetical protein SELMODRAFT_445583 [Selaginella moellendorffii]|eukprot:XP_002983590.1 heme-binding-like protein At3g10130, chloroplastic [Selaginella moellendorffii]